MYGVLAHVSVRLNAGSSETGGPAPRQPRRALLPRRPADLHLM